MNGFFKGFLAICAKFFTDKGKVRLSLLAILGLVVLLEHHISGLARRTFVFYAVDNGALTVEDRHLKRADSPERDIKRYMDDALLGPVSPGLATLFSGNPRLESLIYQDGAVFADFSQDAALPPEGGSLYRSFYTLYAGIKRNFPFVKDIRFFIEGKAAYPEGFEENLFKIK
jgi:hypothetical protein